MSKKLLVVDDSVFIWREMKVLLEGTDYEIVSYAKSGEEGLSNYETCRPDLVTLDIILPGLDGIDTAKAMLARWPDAKIVIVSSLAYDDMVDQAKEAGVFEFIFKPFEKESLLAALDRASK